MNKVDYREHARFVKVCVGIVCRLVRMATIQPTTKRLSYTFTQWSYYESGYGSHDDECIDEGRWNLKITRVDSRC
jgi:hypothetical protein